MELHNLGSERQLLVIDVVGPQPCLDFPGVVFGGAVGLASLGHLSALAAASSSFKRCFFFVGGVP